MGRRRRNANSAHAAGGNQDSKVVTRAPPDAQSSAATSWTTLPMCEESAQRLEQKFLKFQQQQQQQQQQQRQPRQRPQQRQQKQRRPPQPHHKACGRNRPCDLTSRSQPARSKHGRRSQSSLMRPNHKPVSTYFPGCTPLPGQAGTLTQQRVREHLTDILPLLSPSLLQSPMHPARLLHPTPSHSACTPRWADMAEPDLDGEQALASAAAMPDDSAYARHDISPPTLQQDLIDKLGNGHYIGGALASDATSSEHSFRCAPAPFCLCL